MKLSLRDLLPNDNQRR